MCIFDEYTTYFAVGIKNGATLSFPFLIEDYDTLYFCTASVVIVPIIVSCNLVVL